MGKEYDLRARTMRFALDVGQLCRQFPNTPEGRHVRGQLFRAGTGLASNYRAACRGRSKADFIAKLGNAVEEGDEAEFWMDFSTRAGLLKHSSQSTLRGEVNELVAILIRSQITARENIEREKRNGKEIGTSTKGITGLIVIALLLHYTLFNILN